MFIKRILLATTPELGLGILLVFSSSIGQTFFICQADAPSRTGNRRSSLAHPWLPRSHQSLYETVYVVTDSLPSKTPSCLGDSPASPSPSGRTVRFSGH